MLGLDDYLWVYTFVVMAAGTPLFLYCEDGEFGGEYRPLFTSGGDRAFTDTPENTCCCCPPCTVACNYTPRVWGTVDFSGVLDKEIVPPPDPVYACAAGSADESEKICEKAGGLNDTSFEVYCADLDPCTYYSSSYSGQYCGLDSIEVDLHHSYGGDVGVWIEISDNEPSPTDYAWFFEEPSSYPMDCTASQSPEYVGQGDEICDFSDATATFTPLCDEPTP